MPPRIHPPNPITRWRPSPQTHCTSCLLRAFSTSPQYKRTTLLRRRLFAWLNGPGAGLREPVPNSTNYLSAYDMRTGKRLTGPKGARRRGGPDAQTADSQALEDAAVDDSRQASADDRALRPFPMNPHFVSQSVLSESLRQEVWRRVQVEKKPARQVSVELGIEMRRVGAVVRLVEVERRMRAEGQTLALPYAKAIHSMLPLTPYNANNPSPPVHEPINDLPVHPLTAPQLFYPTSESRQFNRTDAGRVFSAAPRLPDSQDAGQGGTPARQPWEDLEKEFTGKPLAPQGHPRFKKKGNPWTLVGEMEILKPADARIPHPHLIAHEQDKLSPELARNSSEIQKRYHERIAQDERRREEARKRREAKEEATKTRVQSERWEWVVQDVASERLGQGVVGSKYGVPSQERKKGMVKIPRKVEV